MVKKGPPTVRLFGCAAFCSCCEEDSPLAALPAHRPPTSAALSMYPEYDAFSPPPLTAPAAPPRCSLPLQEDKEAYQIPYEVQDDKVGGLTIKLVGNEGDKWTQALKYMLTDLKWLVGMLSTFPTKES